MNQWDCKLFWKKNVYLNAYVTGIVFEWGKIVNEVMVYILFRYGNQMYITYQKMILDIMALWCDLFNSEVRKGSKFCQKSPKASFSSSDIVIPLVG